MTVSAAPEAPQWLQDVTMQELERNPYPVYERLRREQPLAYVPVLGAYVASSREICSEIANHPEFGGIITKAGGRTFGHPAVIGVNGEIHKDLRSMVDPALQPSEVDRWVEGMVRPIAQQYVANIELKGRAELMSEFCEKVSVRAVGNLLGLQSVDSDKLREWFHKLSNSFTNAAVDENGEFANPEGFQEGDEAKAEIRSVVDPLIDRWIVEPDDSAMSHWLHDGMPGGTTRDRDYLYPTLYVFLLGALQEPGHAIGSTLAGLFTRPDQLEAVIDEPGLLPRAIAEGMRWTSPIWSATARVSEQDTVIAGVHLPANTPVLMSYGSANHDANAYDAPSTYDITRPPLPHLAFGTGKHACAGIYFANHVCRIALEELLDTLPNLELDPDHKVDFWGWGFRGPTELHCQWEV